jgi:hypothetical protein
MCLGINLASARLDDSVDAGKSYAYCYDGVTRTGTLPNPSYGGTFGNGDIIGVAYDADNGTLVFYKNGTSLGQAFSGIPANTWFPYVTHYTSSGSYLNFGQRTFAYQTPGTNRPAATFKALVDTNLPPPLVTKPNTVFDVVKYDGNGGTQNITGLSFSPDFVWLKVRNTTGGHPVFDTIRGATNYLQTHSTGAEGTDTDALTAFTSNGFTLGSGGTIVNANINGNTYVAWAWDAGTGSPVSNTQGSITSSVRANPTAGFSIVTWTGTGTNSTIGHGGLVNLDKGMIIIKSRSTLANWMVGHGSTGWSAVFEGLNTTNAVYTSNSAWNNTAPTSTVFSVTGSDANMNGSGRSQLAYCFAPVSGYSSFGSYAGNGSSDGVFVFTAMRPRFVLIKAYDATATWSIFDAARDSYNVGTKGLYPNSSGAEESIWGIDFLSNGFKLRTANGGVNQSGLNYIYAAFAESPFNYARAR